MVSEDVGFCRDCNWNGLHSELKEGPNTLDELCPACGSNSTWDFVLDETGED